MKLSLMLCAINILILCTASAQIVRHGAAPEWRRHVIDATSKGADGVKTGDFNGDGKMDLVTGWEEGGVVRVYLNPGPTAARAPWEQLTVGNVTHAEDAIFADLDGDGKLEVVSATEGTTRTVYWHRPQGNEWRTDAFPVVAGTQAWMQVFALNVDGHHGQDLMLGSKGKGATIGWLQAPAVPATLADWRYHPLRDAGWIMSLVPTDLDADGDPDLLFTDRKGTRSGVFWLENPGRQAIHAGKEWIEHSIGALGREVMFADVGFFDADAHLDVAVAVKPHEIHLYRGRENGAWTPQVIHLLDDRIGFAKAIKSADLNGDGLTDLAFTCESAHGAREGIVWLENRGEDPWQQHSLSGPAGTKFDLIELLDLDADGHLDLITCEEHEQLGVVWYENPSTP